MYIDQILAKHSMTSADLARSAQVSPAEVFQWRKGLRPVPIKRCVAIEKATAGVITRKDLRPDDWHLIWPELKEKSHA